MQTQNQPLPSVWPTGVLLSSGRHVSARAAFPFKAMSKPNQTAPTVTVTDSKMTVVTVTGSNEPKSQGYNSSTTDTSTAKEVRHGQ